MLVRSRMTPNVHAASPDTTLAESLGMTRAHRIRHLPILENDPDFDFVPTEEYRAATGDPPFGRAMAEL